MYGALDAFIALRHFRWHSMDDADHMDLAFAAAE